MRKEREQMRTLQSYEGYIERGQVFPVGLPTGIVGRVIITILDEPLTLKDEADNEHAEAWSEFLDGIAEIKDEPVPEFERVRFREVDI
jgi:hypothetical protein